MNEDIVIEQAKPSDLNDIQKIESLSFESDQFSRQQFIYLMTHAKGAFYVVRLQTHVVAYISLLTHALTKNLRIYSIAVHPEIRGRKLGQALIDKSIEYARWNKLKTITLEVKTTNIAAITLYEKNGFIKTGIKYNYYHDDSNAYCMKLNLNL